MSQWPMVKLGDVCTVVGGGTPKTAIPEYWGGTIPWLTPKDLSGNKNLYISRGERSITESGLDNSGATLLPKGTVLWSSRAPIGHVAIAETDVATNQGFKSFIPGPNVDSEYLAYTLIFMKDQFQRIGTGATFKEVSAKRAKSIQIPLPPLEEQRRIARALSIVESANQHYLETCSKINTLRDNYFLTIISNQSKILRSEALEEVVDSVIDCPHSTPKWTESGIPCIWTNNLRKGYFNWDAPRFVSSETYKSRSARAYLQEGDIILSREGTVGVAAIIPRNFKGCMGQRLVQVRPNSSSIPGPWVLASLLYLLDPVRVSHFMVGATSKHLNVRDLRKLQIPIPTEQTLKRFIEFDTKSNELLKEAQKRSLLTQELYNSLATRAFAGQL